MNLISNYRWILRYKSEGKSQMGNVIVVLPPRIYIIENIGFSKKTEGCSC